TRDGQVSLDLADEVRVGQPEAIPRRWAIELCIPPALDPHRPSAAARLELEAPCARRLRERIATAGSVEGAADQSVSAGHDASAGDVDDGQQLRNLVHHVVAGQDVAPHRADLRNAPPVASALEHRFGDQRDRFREVELQPSLTAPSSQVRGDIDEELLGLPWSELHLPPRCWKWRLYWGTGMVSGAGPTPPPAMSAANRSAQPEGEPQGQAPIGVVDEWSDGVGDPLESVRERVGVDVQAAGGHRDLAGGEEDLER